MEETKSEHLVTEEQLKAWTGFKQTKLLIDFLRENQIPYLRGKAEKVVTTVGAINKVLNKEENKEHSGW